MTIPRPQPAGTVPLVLGFDCGTEGMRAVAATPTGEIVAEARQGHPTTFPRPGRAEQHPADWWAGLVAAAREMLAAGLDPNRISGLAIAATSSTVVAAQADGTPVHPALLWMDIRAQAEAREFTLTNHPALDVCPDGVSPEWGPPKALWLQRNLSDAYAATDVLCEGGDWLIHRLTGGWTLNLPAAVTAWFYDAQADRWPTDLYQAAGCRDLAKKLPRTVLAPGTVAGPLRAEIAAELGLPAGIPVVAGASIRCRR